MGKYLSVLGGIVAVVIGIMCLFKWWEPEILAFLKAILVMVLIFGGLLALIAGISEIKDTSAQEEK